MCTFFLLLLAVDAGAAAGVPRPTALIEAAPNPAPKRAASQIIADYQKAIGSESAWKRHKSVHIRREISMKAMRFSGTEDLVIARGGKYQSTATLPGMGTIRIGTNGTTAWSEDPIHGLRLLKGAEAEELRLAASWNAEWRLLKLYRSARPVPLPPEAPKDAAWECVELAKKAGSPSTLCFDALTHLRVFEKGTKASPGGEMPYISRFSDWRPVNEVLVWHKEDLTLGPLNLEARITQLTFNEPIAKGTFDLPKKSNK